MNKTTSFLALSFASVTLLASCGGGDASSSGRGTGLADALAFARENSFGITGTAYTAFDALTSEKGGEEFASYELHNVFSEGILSSEVVYHYDIGDGHPFDDTVSATYFAKEDGLTYRRGLTVQNQVMDDVVKSSSTGKSLVFKEHFDSPMKTLKYSDFVSLNGQFLLKPQVAKTFALSLTQQSISAQKVLFDLKDGKLSDVTIFTSSASTSIGGVYSSQRLELHFNWGEVGKIPDIKPYAHESVHDTLELGLYNLGRQLKSKNYTVTTDLETQEGKAVGHYYATPECVYSDATDGVSSYGATKVGTGFYEFSVTTNSSGEQKVTIYDENPISESDLFPSFSSFAPELFVSEDGKKFTCRPGIEKNVILLFVPYTEASYYASFVSELRFNLDAKGAFMNAEIDYYDYQNMVQGTATLTYGSFDETVVPVDF